MGSLALRPGDSLTILLDGLVNRLSRIFQFPSFLLFKLRAWTFTPMGLAPTDRMPAASLDAHISVLIRTSTTRIGNSTLLHNCDEQIAHGTAPRECGPEVSQQGDMSTRVSFYSDPGHPPTRRRLRVCTLDKSPS